MDTRSSSALSSAAPASSEQDGIRRAVDLYVEGMRTGSPETLKQAFHPEAMMSGYLGETLMVTPIQGLYDFVVGQVAPVVSGEPFHCEVRSIEESGGVASVRIAEHSYLGHEFDTFFHLLKVDGRWQIISKVFGTVASPRQP